MKSLKFTTSSKALNSTILSNQGIIRKGCKILAFSWVLLNAHDAKATYTQYSVTNAGDLGLYDITLGPDGNVWFTDRIAHLIGKITPTGTVSTFTSNIAGDQNNSRPRGITTGPDGNLWVTKSNSNFISKIDPATNTITNYNTGLTAASGPRYITKGSDNNLWFTEFNAAGNRIGKITTAGTITQVALSTPNSAPSSITSGPDGALWFTEENRSFIGRISTNGVLNDTFSTGGGAATFITSGPDGNLWFTSDPDNTINSMNTSGVITASYPLGGPVSPQGIVSAPDGKLWFVIYDTNELRSIDPATGSISNNYTIPTVAGVAARPQNITVGADNNLWFTLPGSKKIGRYTITVPVVQNPSIPLNNTTPAENVVAGYFNNLPDSQGTGDLHNIFLSLIALSPETRNEALEDISGSQTQSLGDTVKTDGYLINSISASRMDALRDLRNSSPGRMQSIQFVPTTGLNKISNKANTSNIHMGLAAEMAAQTPQLHKNGGVWMQALGQDTHQKTTTRERGSTAQKTGLMTGLDHKLGQNIFIGAGVGGVNNEVKWRDNGGKGRIRGKFATVYGTVFFDQVHLDLAVVGGLNRYKINRQINFVGRTARSKYSGSEVTPHVGLGYEMNMGSCTVEPFISEDLSYVRTDGYTETGANAINLHVKSSRSSTLRSEAGAIMEKIFNFATGSWRANFKASYVQKNPIKKGNQIASFQNQTATFTIDNPIRTTHQVALGTGATVNYTSGLFAGLRYDTELGASSKSHMAGIRLGWTW